MKDQPIFPLLIKLALPMVLSMMINSLYNIVDSYFIAQINENALTALSLVFPIQNLLSAIAIGIGIGINATIAIFLGMDKKEKANKAASIGMSLTVIHGLIFTILALIIMPIFLNTYHVSQDIYKQAIVYTRIVFLFTTFNMMQITFEKIYQSVGHMIISMFAMMIGCILNIILDPIFIFVLNGGIIGAALATGLGQFTSLIIYILFYINKKCPLHINKKYVDWNREIIHKIYATGIPATLNLALPSVLISSLNTLLSQFSGIYVVILGVYYKLQTFLYLPANGLVQGMRPIVGFNYGAKRYDRVNETSKWVLILSIIIMLVGMILCFLIPNKLIGLFTTNGKTINEGMKALRIISCGFIISTVSLTVSGALEGMGKGMPSLIISLCRYILIMIPLSIILTYLLGPKGVWYSFVFTEFITAIISIFIYKKVIN